MTPVELLLSKLPDVKRNGKGWVARCPAHEDKRPSLSISEGADGRALLHCHAGCAPDEIATALRMTLADLMPPRAGPSPTKAPAGGPGQKAKALKVFATARKAIAELERRHGPRSAVWTYHDADGEPVGMVVRWNKRTGKEIRPVSKSTGSPAGWIIGGISEPRPLYRLPELLATKPGSRVWICEGEKAADAARAIGLAATTSPHGAKSAAKADWSPLSGRDAIILPDLDEAGEQYGADVVKLARAAGAKSVRVVRLVDAWPDLPTGGDIADLANCDNADTIVTRLGELADAAKIETPNAPAPAMELFKPFPVDVLPEPIRSFIAEAAKAIGCDASYVALPLLSALASSIGNTHRIELKRGWTEPAIVWTAIVGDSGTAKSPALELALRPIRKRQHEAMKRHAEAMERYANALAIYERDVTQWKRSKSDVPPPAKPEVPIADRCWTDDVTTEALAVLLQQNPRGMLMARDELAGWFNFDRYAQGKGGDVAKWLEMFGARPMIVDRKTGGTMYVPCAAVSIAGGIQPETLRRALGREHRDNGLAARLLLACPPRREKRWTEDDVSAYTETAVALVFDRLFSLTPETDDCGDARPRLVMLADDGKRAWVKFYNEHAGEQVNLSGDEAAAWSKLEGYAARLALVVHLVRWAVDDPTLTNADKIDADSIEAGVKLSRWFGNEARRAYVILGESDEGRQSRRLVEWLEGAGGAVTVRDLTRGPREYRGDPKRAAKALGELVASGVGRWEVDDHAGGRGRSVDRFRLLSRLGDTGDGDTNSKNTGNRAVSVAVATVAKTTDTGDRWAEA